MANADRKPARTAPKGRPTPGRASRREEITWWQRYRVQLQWAAIVATITVIVILVIVLSEPRPLHNG
ncbi:MAG: hypothetical protein AAGA17_12640 [Actinomycetota bacterium]